MFSCWMCGLVQHTESTFQGALMQLFTHMLNMYSNCEGSSFQTRVHEECDRRFHTAAILLTTFVLLKSAFFCKP